MHIEAYSDSLRQEMLADCRHSGHCHQSLAISGPRMLQTIGARYAELLNAAVASGSPFESLVAFTVRMTAWQQKRARDPNILARAVFSAVTSRRPKPRYLVDRGISPLGYGTPAQASARPALQIRGAPSGRPPEARHRKGNEKRMTIGNPVVETTYGPVRGIDDGLVRAFATPRRRSASCVSGRRNRPSGGPRSPTLPPSGRSARRPLGTSRSTWAHHKPKTA